MGLVHFLHGNPKRPESDESGEKIRCPNPNCLKLISDVLLLNGKKVCPACKTVLPDTAFIKDKDNQEIPCSSCGRLVSEYVMHKKEKVCPYCQNPFTVRELKYLKPAKE